MIELGTVTVGHQGRATLRENLHDAVMLLCGDPLSAARVSIGASQLTRSDGLDGTLLTVALHGDDQVVLRLEPPPVDMSSLSGSALFDRVVARSDAVELWFRVRRFSGVGEAHLERLRSMMGRLSRDELMTSLTLRNRELRDSLDELRRTTSEKQRMADELNIGRAIQMSMLPAEFPVSDDFSVAAVLHPAREVGGDFYDVFTVGDDLWVCVGDVAGKGVPAALFMAMAKTLIKSQAASESSPARILEHVNDELSANNDTYMFVTVFLSALDVRTGSLRYTNAGHNPPYLLKPGEPSLPLDQRHGPVVAALPGSTYEEDVVQLGIDDVLLLYTDGVTESMDADAALFSDERLATLLSSSENRGAESLVRTVLDDVRQHQGEAEQADDITLLAVRNRPSSQLVESLSIDADIAALPVLSGLLEELGRRLGLDDPIVARMQVVLDDIVSNVVNHAFADDQSDANHEIDVSFEAGDGLLILEVSDHGRPFDPTEAPTPDTSLGLHERLPGGLGLHLVRTMVDEMTYRRFADRNIVRMTMHTGARGTDS